MKPVARIALAAAIAASPASAAAQSGPAVRGYFSLGSTSLAAAQTFEAVSGTSRGQHAGGGVRVTVWRGLFADVGASRLELSGERVFVHDGEVFELGIPLTVTMRPLDVAAGWRVILGRISPYAAAGVTYLTYEETAEFGETGDEVRETRPGPLALGGVDVEIWRWLHAGAELRYRQVKKILGAGGVSAGFGEDDAGGFAAAVRISVGR